MTDQENSPVVDGTPNMEVSETDVAETPLPNEIQDVETDSPSGTTPDPEASPAPEAAESDISISASELNAAVQNMSSDAEEMDLGDVQENLEKVEAGVTPMVTQVHPAEFQPLHSSPSAPENEPSNIDMLLDVALKVSVELGRAQLPVRDVLDLQSGAVIELDRVAGDLVDIFINNRLIARGEVVVVDDKFGVRISEIFSSE